MIWSKAQSDAAGHAAHERPRVRRGAVKLRAGKVEAGMLHATHGVHVSCAPGVMPDYRHARALRPSCLQYGMINGRKHRLSTTPEGHRKAHLGLEALEQQALALFLLSHRVHPVPHES